MADGYGKVIIIKSAKGLQSTKYKSNTWLSCASDGTWWRALATKTVFNGGIPGLNGGVAKKVELWAKIAPVIMKVTLSKSSYIETLYRLKEYFVTKNYELYNTTLNIEFDDTVVEIPDYAFHKLPVEGTLNIPKNITRIGECAFLDCPKVFNLKFDYNSELVDVGDNAFLNSGLSKIECQENVQRVVSD